MVVVNADIFIFIFNERRVNYNCNEILILVIRLVEIKRFVNIFREEGCGENGFLFLYVMGGNGRWYRFLRGNLVLFIVMESVCIFGLEFYF